MAVRLHRELARVLPLIVAEATDDIGYPVSVVSAGRSLAEQRKLNARYKRGTGGRAAPAGQSAHNYGLAVDVVIRKPGVDPWEWSRSWSGRRAYAKLHRVAKRYGLESIVATAPDDPFHLQAPNWRRVAGGALASGKVPQKHDRPRTKGRQGSRGRSWLYGAVARSRPLG